MNSRQTMPRDHTLALCGRPRVERFTSRPKRTGKTWQRLSDRLLELLDYFGLGFEQFVIIALGHDDSRSIGLLNDFGAIIRRERGDELDRLFDVTNLASEAAVASQEAGCVGPIRAKRLHLFDVGRLLQRGNALQAIGVTDGADRIVLSA